MDTELALAVELAPVEQQIVIDAVIPRQLGNGYAGLERLLNQLDFEIQWEIGTTS